MKTSNNASDERTLAMAVRYAAGETLDAIGRDYGLTRERVRQILQKSGLVDAAGARAARQARRLEADETLREQLLAWAAANPGRSRDVAAAELGIDVSEIGRLLGAEARLRFIEERHHEPQVSDEEVLAGLRRAAAALGDPLVADRYDTYVPVHGLLSSVRIIQRWGTWNAACRAAGLGVNSGRRSYRRRWTEAEMLEHVANYLMGEGCRGTYYGYDAYARSASGAPSAQTVRNTFGAWANIKAAAQHVVAARERRQRVA
jgi:hypothetical protein